jgi:AhpD family alkylhydroperoxidase
VPAKTLKMMHLRASQINNCSFCVDMHAKELKKLGEPDERIFAVSAWREAPYFKEEERAALARPVAQASACVRVYQEHSRTCEAR